MINLYSSDPRVRARVLKKDPVRTYTNARGQGKVTSITIMDSSEKPLNQIRLTMFGDTIDRYYELLQEKSIFIFQGLDVKPKNGKFNKTAHECELTLRRDAVIEAAPEDKKIAENTYNFELVSAIEGYERYHELDVLVMIQSNDGSESINLKNGEQKLKTAFTVFDESGLTVELTMWGDDSPGFCHLVPDQIVALRGVKVGEFRGKNLSSGWGISIDIDIPQNLPRYKSLKQFCLKRINAEPMKPLNDGAVSSKFKGNRWKLSTIQQMESESIEAFQNMTEDEKKNSP
jgi:replication factor A1